MRLKDTYIWRGTNNKQAMIYAHALCAQEHEFTNTSFKLHEDPFWSEVFKVFLCNLHV